MESWLEDIRFESPGPVRRFVRTALVNPVANSTPPELLKYVLRITKSELAAANWQDPGGWKSMVITYDGKPRQWADKVLVGTGTMAMALRNRRRLAGRLLARLIDAAQADPVHVVGLGAGPGQITIDALLEANCTAKATLVDISADAFEFGRNLAEDCGLGDRVTYLQGDARELAKYMIGPAHIVTMLGLCEYIPDELLAVLAAAAHRLLPPGAPLVFNSLSHAHGTDRFFRRVFGLHMIHRSPAVIRDLMASAGFGGFVSHPEPLGVYHVIVGRSRTQC